MLKKVQGRRATAISMVIPCPFPGTASRDPAHPHPPGSAGFTLPAIVPHARRNSWRFNGSPIRTTEDYSQKKVRGNGR